MTKPHRNAFLLVVAVLLASSCSSELGRAPFADMAPQRITVDLDASKKVDFWVHLDVKYEGRQQLGFEIDLEQGGKQTGTTRCNAFDISTKMMAVETTVNGASSKRYRGKMRCSMSVREGGPTVFVVTPFADPRAGSLKTFDLVVKQ